MTDITINQGITKGYNNDIDLDLLSCTFTLVAPPDTPLLTKDNVLHQGLVGCRLWRLPCGSTNRHSLTQLMDSSFNKNAPVHVATNTAILRKSLIRNFIPFIGVAIRPPYNHNNPFFDRAMEKHGGELEYYMVYKLELSSGVKWGILNRQWWNTCIVRRLGWDRGKERIVLPNGTIDGQGRALTENSDPLGVKMHNESKTNPNFKLWWNSLWVRNGVVYPLMANNDVDVFLPPTIGSPERSEYEENSSDENFEDEQTIRTFLTEGKIKLSDGFRPMKSKLTQNGSSATGNDITFRNSPGDLGGKNNHGDSRVSNRDRKRFPLAIPLPPITSNGKTLMELANQYSNNREPTETDELILDHLAVTSLPMYFVQMEFEREREKIRNPSHLDIKGNTSQPTPKTISATATPTPTNKTPTSDHSSSHHLFTLYSHSSLKSPTSSVVANIFDPSEPPLVFVHKTLSCNPSDFKSYQSYSSSSSSVTNMSEEIDTSPVTSLEEDDANMSGGDGSSNYPEYGIVAAHNSVKMYDPSYEGYQDLELSDPGCTLSNPRFSNEYTDMAHLWPTVLDPPDKIVGVKGNTYCLIPGPSGYYHCDLYPDLNFILQSNAIIVPVGKYSNVVGMYDHPRIDYWDIPLNYQAQLRAAKIDFYTPSESRDLIGKKSQHADEEEDYDNETPPASQAIADEDFEDEPPSVEAENDDEDGGQSSSDPEQNQSPSPADEPEIIDEENEEEEIVEPPPKPIHNPPPKPQQQKKPNPQSQKQQHQSVPQKQLAPQAPVAKQLPSSATAQKKVAFDLAEEEKPRKQPTAPTPTPAVKSSTPQQKKPTTTPTPAPTTNKPMASKPQQQQPPKKVGSVPTATPPASAPKPSVTTAPKKPTTVPGNVVPAKKPAGTPVAAAKKPQQQQAVATQPKPAAKPAAVSNKPSTPAPSRPVEKQPSKPAPKPKPVEKQINIEDQEEACFFNPMFSTKNWTMDDVVVYKQELATAPSKSASRPAPAAASSPKAKPKQQQSASTKKAPEPTVGNKRARPQETEEEEDDDDSKQARKKPAVASDLGIELPQDTINSLIEELPDDLKHFVSQVKPIMKSVSLKYDNQLSGVNIVGDYDKIDETLGSVNIHPTDEELEPRRAMCFNSLMQTVLGPGSNMGIWAAVKRAFTLFLQYYSLLPENMRLQMAELSWLKMPYASSKDEFQSDIEHLTKIIYLLFGKVVHPSTMPTFGKLQPFFTPISQYYFVNPEDGDTSIKKAKGYGRLPVNGGTINEQKELAQNKQQKKTPKSANGSHQSTPSSKKSSAPSKKTASPPASQQQRQPKKVVGK